MLETCQTKNSAEDENASAGLADAENQLAEVQHMAHSTPFGPFSDISVACHLKPCTTLPWGHREMPHHWGTVMHTVPHTVLITVPHKVLHTVVHEVLRLAIPTVTPPAVGAIFPSVIDSAAAITDAHALTYGA